ncbi:MAG: hypothetical protein GC191_12990 [Azospirillum sp.]|nr:hypothetical protein [Azospirillum sp.]
MKLPKPISSSLRLLAGIVLFALWLAPSVHAADATRERWQASANGLDELQGLVAPNLAIGLPIDLATKYISRYLSIETGTLYTTVGPDAIIFDQQIVSAEVGFSLTVPSGTTGLPNDIRIGGSANVLTGLVFSGYDFKFLPRIKGVSVASIQDVVTHQNIPLPAPLEVRIPDWLQDSIVAYLGQHGRLQLPVILAEQIGVSVKALGAGGPPVALSKRALGTEYWVSGASILIDDFGVVGIAELHFDQTFPKCEDLVPELPMFRDVKFTRFGSSEPITVLTPDIPSVVLRGSAGDPRRSYTLYFRLGGVTISTHSIAISTSAGGQNYFEVPLAIRENSRGVYSALVTTRIDVAGGTSTECVVSVFQIVRPRAVDLAIPDPLSPQQALDKFAEFRDLFGRKATGSDARFAPGALYFSVSKASLAQTISRVVSGAGILGKIDAAGLPAVDLQGAKIRVPDSVAKMACEPTRDCTPVRDCTPPGKCSFDEDRRDCKRSSIFGSYNDPICEILKAGENTARRLDYDRCLLEEGLAKLDCERIKSTEKATCELEKSAEKLKCEAIKSAVFLLAPDQNLATVNGRFNFDGSVDFALRDLTIEDGFNQATVGVDLSADLGVGASIEFIPNNLGGHILGCISKWKESTHLQVKMPADRREIYAQTDVDSFASTVHVRVRLPELLVKFSPSPFVGLFGSHPHLIAACPVLFTAGVAEGLYDLLSPEYKSTLWTGDYKLEERDLEYEVVLPKIDVPANTNFPPLQLSLQDDGPAFTWW